MTNAFDEGRLRESDIQWLKHPLKISIPYYTILIRLPCTILNCSLKTPHIRMTDELKKGERFFCSLQRPPGSFDIHPVMGWKTPNQAG